MLSILFAFALIAAACGDDDDDGGGEDPSPPRTTPAPRTRRPTRPRIRRPTRARGDEDPPADDGAGDDPPADEGASGGAEGLSDFTPRGPATGEPIKIGFQNPEGDPAGSFPEYTTGAEAAVNYINEELGGLGGRPIELDVCVMAITPDDSQRCANELSADGVEFAFSSLNFFGNHFSIYGGSDIPVVVGTPITVGDFTAPGVFSIGTGGGCLGTHTGLIYFGTQVLPEITGEPIERVSVPWADTPPGVVCYYDLEAKPLDVLNGSVPGDSELAGSMPDLEHIGVPVLPGSADVTAQATEVLDFDPDVIIYSAQGADCWTFVDAMGRLGWTPDQVPLLLSTACVDFTAMEQAGDLAVGIYFVGAGGTLTTDPAALPEGSKERIEAELYQTKAIEYGMSEDDLTKGFGTAGFSNLIKIWEMANIIVDGGGEVTGQTLADAFAATDNTPVYSSTPLDCANAPAPYVAVCDSSVSVSQWDGENLIPVESEISGLDLVAGTELQPGPS